MTDNEHFLLTMRDGGKAAGHLFPEMAACEIAVESGWGHSGLILLTNNAFGQKAPYHIPPGMKIWDHNTREVKSGVAVNEDASWIVFDSLADSFKARMDLLHRAPAYYFDAVNAKDPVSFAMQVSAQWLIGQKVDHTLDPKDHPVIPVMDVLYQFLAGRWSTDPTRGPASVKTFNAHKGIFG